MSAMLELPKDAETAKDWIARAPHGSTVTFKRPARSLDQNALMWKHLTTIARATQHNGAVKSPEVWKCLFLHALGHETRFEMGLNGEPFPVGFRSSHLSKEQMSDLLEFIQKWAAENEIDLGDA